MRYVDFDGKEIAPGIFVIGDIRWHEKDSEWRCLANVNGDLALVAVRVTECDHVWTDMRNEVITSGEWCRKCSAVRP